MSSNDIPMPRQLNVAKPSSPRSIEKMRAFAVDLATAEEERDAAAAERDHFKADYERALDLCNDARHTIGRLETDCDDLRRRCTEYQKERDEAVVRFGRLQSLFVAFRAQMQAFEIPQPKSPQYVAPEAEATSPREETSA